MLLCEVFKKKKNVAMWINSQTKYFKYNILNGIWFFEKNVITCVAFFLQNILKCFVGFNLTHEKVDHQHNPSSIETINGRTCHMSPIYFIPKTSESKSSQEHTSWIIKSDWLRCIFIYLDLVCFWCVFFTSRQHVMLEYWENPIWHITKEPLMSMNQI